MVALGRRADVGEVPVRDVREPARDEGSPRTVRVPDGTASRIILGRLGAERLLGKGDLYVDFGLGPVRGQAAVVQVR